MKFGMEPNTMSSGDFAATRQRPSSAAGRLPSRPRAPRWTDPPMRLHRTPVGANGVFLQIIAPEARHKASIET